MLRGKTLLAAAALGLALVAGYVGQTEARRSDDSGVTSHRRGDLQVSVIHKNSFVKKKKNRVAKLNRKKKLYRSARAGKKARYVSRYRAGKKVRYAGRVKNHRRGSAHIIASVRSHARAHGVPERVALALVNQESGFNPRARGAAGEIGLMQLKCSTARGMGYRGSCGGLYNVSTNLSYGMRYLKLALRRGSVAYYNAGIYARRLPAAAKRYARSVNSRI